RPADAGRTRPARGAVPLDGVQHEADSAGRGIRQADAAPGPVPGPCRRPAAGGCPAAAGGPTRHGVVRNPGQVLRLAPARALAGADAVLVSLPERATVGDLRRRLAEEHPALRPLLGRSALAVNEDFADDDLTLPLRAEVALLPPVSGG